MATSPPFDPLRLPLANIGVLYSAFPSNSDLQDQLNIAPKSQLKHNITPESQSEHNGGTIAPSTIHPPLPQRRLSLHRAVQVQGLPQGQGDHHHWYLTCPPCTSHANVGSGAVGVIGQGLAESFAAAGAKLILTYNNTPPAPALSARCLELGASSVEFIKCNVASLEGCQYLVDQVRPSRLPSPCQSSQS